MSIAFTLVIVGFLLALSALEVLRYQRAGRGEEELPYPARRLRRRLSISVLLILMLLATIPGEGLAPTWRLLQLGGILLVALLALALLWRELRETSLEVVSHANELNRREAEKLTRLIEEEKRKKSE